MTLMEQLTEKIDEVIKNYEELRVANSNLKIEITRFAIEQKQKDEIIERLKKELQNQESEVKRALDKLNMIKIKENIKQ